MKAANVKKLNAAAIGIPAGVVIAWAVEQFGGVTVPAEIGAAIGAICTFVASVAIPDTHEE